MRQDILDEVDGPMLRHGLLGMHGDRLAVVPRKPQHRPGTNFLAKRYEGFRAAG